MSKVALPLALMLRTEHAETLARLHITNEILEAAGVRSVTDIEARETLGLKGDADLAGILFPYLSPITRERIGGRLRLNPPAAEGAQIVRRARLPPPILPAMSERAASRHQHVRGRGRGGEISISNNRAGRGAG